MNKFKAADGDTCDRTPTVAKDGLTARSQQQETYPEGCPQPVISLPCEDENVSEERNFNSKNHSRGPLGASFRWGGDFCCSPSRSRFLHSRVGV